MANLRLLWNNLITGSSVVVTASSQVTSLPGGNAVIPDRSLVWRSATSTGDQSIQFDLGSAQAVTAVAVANPKLHASGGTLKLQSSPDTITWTDRGALSAADADTKVAYLFIGSVSARYWRLYFTNVGAVSDYVEVGYAGLGTYFEPQFNVIGPLDSPLGDRSVITESLTGQRSTTVRPQQSHGRFAWKSMPESDRATLQQIFRSVGLGTPFFAVLSTSYSFTAWLLYFRSEMARAFTVVDGYYDTAFDWDEAL